MSSDFSWEMRIVEAMRLLLATGDMPMPGIIRDFVRRHARAELDAWEAHLNEPELAGDLDGRGQ